MSVNDSLRINDYISSLNELITAFYRAEEPGKITASLRTLRHSSEALTDNIYIQLYSRCQDRIRELENKGQKISDTPEIAGVRLWASLRDNSEDNDLKIRALWAAHDDLSSRRQ